MRNMFDTVASAGFLSGAQAAATRSSGGHSGWAQAEFLRVPPNVENCIHMVAMHELRRNFPLDEVGHNGIMLPNCHQYAYPGSHSDVGGGYLPGELGISAGTNPLESDAMKLSQIPLNHMLECAMAAGVPMRKPVAASGKYDPFAIHPKLAQAYSDFAAAITPAPRAMSDHAQQYLNWRWQIRAHFNHSNQVQLANEADRDKLIRCNASLLADAQFLLQGLRATKGISSLLQQVAKKLTPTSILLETGKKYLYEPEAPRLLSLAQQASPTTPAVAALFDGYVHDSLAGFDHPSFEYTGYWRYRKAFLGDDSALTASNETAEAVRAVA
jgi:hypothetical protein